MSQFEFFVGIDWGRGNHHACVIDARGKVVDSRSFEHGGSGLNELADWVTARTGVSSQVAIGIETPHGPVVETMMERNFPVHAINPKQLDRFRDRLSPSGAKDDRRDAYVLAISLRTDTHCFRLLQPTAPQIVQLREFVRITENLTKDRVRLVNRVAQLLWRYFPQFLELERDLSKAWIRELWEMIPAPAKARTARKSTIEKLLRKHRVRRISADEILVKLRTPAITVADGTEEAVRTSLKLIFDQLAFNQNQASEINTRIDQLMEQLTAASDDESGTDWQRDVAILSSIPGVGRIVLATLLAEASGLLIRRDREALRCLCGIAPVTKRSGKTINVMRRLACNGRLRNAMYHWARTAVQHDDICKAKYSTLRNRGHSHARALRGVGDRLLTVACAMLRHGTLFDPNHRQQTLQHAA